MAGKENKVDGQWMLQSVPPALLHRTIHQASPPRTNVSPQPSVKVALSRLATFHTSEFSASHLGPQPERERGGVSDERVGVPPSIETDFPPEPEESSLSSLGAWLRAPKC